MNWILNLRDSNGNIRTGYEQILSGTREEVIKDYLYWLIVIEDVSEVTEEALDIEEGIEEE